MNMLRLRDRRKSTGDGGAVATEFALLMAFVPLTVMAFGIVDYGKYMGQATNLAAIIRGAAEYARGQVVQRGVSALPTAANLNTLLGVPVEVFTPSSFCTCADGSTLPSCPAGDNPCAAIPGGDIRVLTYVGVSGSQTYTPLISGSWNFPGSVQARTVLRTQ
jgi:hypothetical protein